jgi:hypothetical protein
MTAQFRDSLDLHQDEKKGLGVWIVGSGTSLEDVDLQRLRGQHILSLNASIALTRNLNANVWWVYHDMRTYREVYPKIDTEGSTLNCYVHRRGAEQMREYKKSARFVIYRDGEFRPKRTVLETALMLSEFLGFEEAYLLGIDAFAFSGDQRPYAKGLEKTCHFAKQGVKDSWKKSQSSFISALSDLEEKLDIPVFRVSNLFPEEGPFEKSEFDICLERSNKLLDKWNRKRK